MVKLPTPNEEREMAMARARSERTLGSTISTYNLRRGIYRERATGPPPEPKGLKELHEMAKRCVEVMERHGPKRPSNYNTVMDLLRCQYNLNFIVGCEKCGGFQAVDELIAPER